MPSSLAGVMGSDWSAAHLRSRHKWLVTGGAGFIGSHLVHELLRLGQRVTVLDNLSTGSERNLELVRQSLPPDRAAGLEFVRGDCQDHRLVTDTMVDVEFVLHQAALGSIPRSFANPLATDSSNVHGFLTVLDSAMRSGVRSFVYASSSSVYGDSPHLPKQEDSIGRPLSPYAISKLTNELYARVLSDKHRSMRVLGLRYFNVFGPRQNPNGAYAAVIPRWIGEMLEGQQTVVYGDGTNSRDFCYVANVVQANLRAAASASQSAVHHVYNIAAGQRTSLLELHGAIGELVADLRPDRQVLPLQFHEPRTGDIPHSLADVSRATTELGYNPTHDVTAGLRETVRWFASPSGPTAV